MAKDLKQSMRIHVYGGDENEKRAYALIGYDYKDNDSCVTLIRGNEEDIPKLLRKFWTLTEEDIKKILSLNLMCTAHLDYFSQVIRLS